MTLLVFSEGVGCVQLNLCGEFSPMCWGLSENDFVHNGQWKGRCVSEVVQQWYASIELHVIFSFITG